LKAPQHGGFFAIEYQRRDEADVLVSVQSIEQCRRAALSAECYVLGASAPMHRRSEAVDGLYAPCHFERSVQGRIIGVLKGHHHGAIL
jgi:hypothetical protein